MIQEITRTFEFFTELIDYLERQIPRDCELKYTYNGELEGNTWIPVIGLDNTILSYFNVEWETTNNCRLRFTIATYKEKRK